MPRILLVAQDKGGSGKTVLVRALAECLPSAHLIEIEANRRLVELGPSQLLPRPGRAR